MQSKGKSVLFLVVLLVGGVFVAAMMHEPKLVQTNVEQALDASNLSE